MSNPYGFNPKVEHPTLSNNIPQMRSEAFQPRFFFGGSQVPVNLALNTQSNLHGMRGKGFAKANHKPVRLPFH